MTTPNIAMSELSVSQGSKEITHNEALRVLDALVNSGVQTKSLATPPGSPANGQIWIVAASPTGAWAGQAGKVAQYYSGAWYFHAPREGWLAWVNDENLVYAYDGAAWTTLKTAANNFALAFQYSGLAVNNDAIIDGFRFLAAATVTKIGVHAREAPAGSALTVDILKNQSAQSRVASLPAGAVNQITDIADIDFATNEDFGLKITGVGSTAPGNELTVVVYGQYQ